MREFGAYRVKLADGTEVEMGAPAREHKGRTPLSEAELKAAEAERRMRIMFASSNVRPVLSKRAQRAAGK